MKDERFLWIRFSRDAEDGYYITGPLTRAELEARIASDTKPVNALGDWNNGEFTGFVQSFPGLEQLKQRRDSEGKALILRVEAVIPRAVKVVETWEVP